MGAGVFRKWVCRGLCLVACVGMVFSFPRRSYALKRKDHDAIMELILFGERDYKDRFGKEDERYKAIQALEDAVYLAADQYNGDGQDFLDRLNAYGVTGIPKDISEIDYTGNYTHRSKTHEGWTQTYEQDDAKWETIRPVIIVNTVSLVFSKERNKERKIFGFIPIPFKVGLEDSKLDSFCALIYYTHLIGDHAGATKMISLNSIMSLEAIITEVERYLSILFEDQKTTREYIVLIIKLDECKLKARKAIYKGDFDEYKKYTEYLKTGELHLLDQHNIIRILSYRLPELLWDEEFFDVLLDEENEAA